MLEPKIIRRVFCRNWYMMISSRLQQDIENNYHYISKNDETNGKHSIYDKESHSKSLAFHVLRKMFLIFITNIIKC